MHAYARMKIGALWRQIGGAPSWLLSLLTVQHACTVNSGQVPGYTDTCACIQLVWTVHAHLHVIKSCCLLPQSAGCW